MNGDRRFAAFEKHVLRGKAAIALRADAELRDRRVARIERLAPYDHAGHLAVFEITRLPIVTLVGLHRRNVEFIVDHAGIAIPEERQRGCIGPLLIGGQQEARVAGGQECPQSRAFPEDFAVGEQRHAAGQHRRHGAGRRRDQFFA